MKLNDHHRVLLDILIYVDEICRRHQLRYYLVGGTLIGAVRHGGFIPWDDDIDISMPRDDYERFINLCKVELPTHLIVKNYLTDSLSMYNFLKVENINTISIEKDVLHLGCRGGVGIDVFPLDGISKNYFLRILHFEAVHVLRFLRHAHYVDISSKINPFKKIVYSLLQRAFSFRFILSTMDRLCKLKRYNESKLVCNFYGAWGRREIVPKVIFGAPVNVEFEQHSFLAPSQKELYLKRLYNDYMTLPPVEKRVGHHNYAVLDLNKSYLEY